MSNSCSTSSIFWHVSIWHSHNPLHPPGHWKPWHFWSNLVFKGRKARGSAGKVMSPFAGNTQCSGSSYWGWHKAVTASRPQNIKDLFGQWNLPKSKGLAFELGIKYCSGCRVSCRCFLASLGVSLAGTAVGAGGNSRAGLAEVARTDPASPERGARLSPALARPKRIRARACLTADVRMSVDRLREPRDPHACLNSPFSASTAEQARHQLSPKCGADCPHLLHLVIHLKPECYPNNIKVTSQLTQLVGTTSLVENRLFFFTG